MAEVATCPRCLAEMAADAPEGLCPTCLIRQALNVSPAEQERAPGHTPAPRFVPPAPAELAEKFPQFEVIALLGQGGMGAVYRARQLKLDRHVAIKILPPEVARDPAFAERFLREARVLARLSHPHIVTVHDFGEVDGLYYFTMEYVNGQNLRDLLQDGPLSTAQARAIAGQICDALQYAHDEGLVHRDIKPENILLDGKGRMKIADFGLARIVGLTPTYLTLTGTHEVMGTLLYMAPEQMKQAHSVDHRADLYSLGVILYEMLTGELPLGRFAPPSRKVGVNERLDNVVLKALAREPAERYQDAAALKQDLEAAWAVSLAPERPRTSGLLRPVDHSFRFTILCGSGLVAGMAHLDAESFILEFEKPQTNLFEKFKSFFKDTVNPQEKRIPLQEIASLSYGWGWGKPPCSIILCVRRLAVLSGMPGASQGRVRLHIASGDQDAGRQLVEAIARTNRMDQGLCPASWDRARARQAVAGPALGLVGTGVMALVSWVILCMVVWDGRPPQQYLSALFVFPLSGVLIVGGISMLSLRYYPLVATACIVAMVPWSPAFMLGLPFGLWTCILLGKPELTAVFRTSDASLSLRNAVRLDRPPRKAGAFMSFMRSVAGYILPTTVGRESELRDHDVRPSR